MTALLILICDVILRIDLYYAVMRPAAFEGIAFFMLCANIFMLVNFLILLIIFMAVIIELYNKHSF